MMIVTQKSWNATKKIVGSFTNITPDFKAHIPLETGFASANSRVANAESVAQTT